MWWPLWWCCINTAETGDAGLAPSGWVESGGVPVPPPAEEGVPPVSEEEESISCSSMEVSLWETSTRKELQTDSQ